MTWPRAEDIGSSARKCMGGGTPALVQLFRQLFDSRLQTRGGAYSRRHTRIKHADIVLDGSQGLLTYFWLEWTSDTLNVQCYAT
jgi:hypothetical protein